MLTYKVEISSLSVHQVLSRLVDKADSFLMISNLAGFCTHICGFIIVMYALIFYQSEMDNVMSGFLCSFWLVIMFVGLTITTVQGIMVNHMVNCLIILSLHGV
jgi:hypothetical protein